MRISIFNVDYHIHILLLLYVKHICICISFDMGIGVTNFSRALDEKEVHVYIAVVIHI